MAITMAETASAQDFRALYIVVGVVAVGAGVALALGFITGDWIIAPLQKSGQSEQARQRVSEQREQRTCLVVAMLCYYVPALIVVGLHTGTADLIPYLRAHLLDGFGCAALFTVALAPLRQPLAETSARYKPGLEAVGRAALSSLLLTCGSAAIAGAAAWIAGGSWSSVILAGTCILIPVQFFWGLITLRISAAPLDA